MKITKNLEAEILKIYNAYWDDYISGNIGAMEPTLDDHYSQVGSAESEVFTNKKDAVQFLHDTIHEVVGKVEMRNRVIRIEPMNEYILVHELCDLYVLGGDKWMFFNKFRVSTFMHRKNGTWVFIHQHSSFADTKTESGGNLAIENIAAENQELREAVKRRTVELEHKNRDLEIETSLERVRTVAMAMQKPDEIINICEAVFNELQALGFDALRCAIIHAFESGKNYFTDYDYSDIGGGTIAQVPFTGNSVLEKFIDKIRKSKDSFFEMEVSGKEFESWKAFRKSTNMHDDPRLEKTKALFYYVYSVGAASIGISSFQSISPEQLNLLKRFRNVFDLAYRRYSDIQKAEEQAREAQIEAALERVRARTMGMQSSDELPEAANLLFEQIQSFGMSAWSAGYCIFDDDNKSITLCMSSEGVLQPPFYAPLTEDPSFIHIREAYERGEEFWVDEIGGDDLVTHYEYMRTLPVVGEILDSIIEAGHPLPTFQIFHCVYFLHGFLLFITYEPVPEAHDIFQRFGKVFDQTFTRFLDLQKAEAQSQKIKMVNQENERLLHSILPEQIVEQIKTDKENVVKRFEQVSILFADIVGFTILSDKLSPRKVVAILNGLFSKFDDLTDHYHLEKIKTIGDAYMVAAGVPEEKEDHAKVLFHFAKDMLQSLREFNETTGSTLDIRIGMSSGPVVAGVIGKKKFAYDLWGDSVNTAARMEAYGQAGRIQVSPASYALLKNDYTFEKMPGVNIKGKGEMDVYLWVPI